MDPLLGTLVLILLALLGARLSFSTQRVPAGPRLLFRTGTHFLFVGWLLGPGGVALLTADSVLQLHPLLALGLGWVGLLFGMQLDRESLRQFPGRYYVIAFGQAIVTYLLFLGAGWLVVGALGYRGDVPMLMLMVAAATASITTPAGIAMVSANFLVRGNVRQLLFFVASVDAVVGIAALQLAYSVYHPAGVIAGVGEVASLEWVAVAAGLGVLLAITFLWLSRPRPSREELMLYLLGVAALGSGAALQLQLSPLFVCVVAGAAIANLSPERARVYQALQRWEKPIYVILLMLSGALLRIPTWWVLPAAAAYLLLRAAAKVAASALLVRTVRLPSRPPARFGLGLVPQGGISLAMAISFVLTYSGIAVGGYSAVDLLFSVTVLGVVASELVGPFLTAQVLRRAGEISKRVEDALAEGDERKATTEAIRHTAPATPPEGG